jgi:ubiquinone/menaquinone biosynthesis C-methylase UbiE
MNDRERYLKVIEGHFSALTGYWKDIYESPVGLNDFYHHEAVKKRKAAVLDFVDSFSCGRPLRILDSGCGTGVIMEALLERGHEVAGIDLSADMVRETRKTLARFQNGNVVVREGNIESLDFPDGSFDLCVCIGVLQYLKDEKPALRELARVTRPRGHVVFSLPNIVRVTTLLDPYYYLYRGPLFVLRRVVRMAMKKARHTTSEDLSRNLTFKNKRYYYGQLNGACARSGLLLRGVRPIGYGPLTFWHKEYLPRTLTLDISRRIERAVILRPLSFLKAVAERWVFDLEKSPPSS